MEQGFGSLLTFGVNLWLIRNGAAAAYGTYVFWLSVAFAGGVVEGTLVLAHLSRLPSALDRMADRLEPERFMLSVTLAVLCAVMAVVAVGVWLLARAGSELAAAPAILFTPAFLLFQYVRTYAFSRQRPALAAGLSGAILVVTALALGLDIAAGHPPNAGRVLLLTGLAFGGVSAAVLLILLGGIRPMWRWHELRQQAHVMRGFGWLMLGAGSNEITGRLYSFVTVGRFGAEALASLSAVQVLIRPAWLLSSAWASIGFPDMAQRWARKDRDGVMRTMVIGAGVTACCSLLWSAAVLAGWAWVSADLYHGRYREVGPLIYLWGGNVVLGSICTALNTGMLAVGEFRRLALVDLAGAMVTILTLVVVVWLFTYPYAIAATMLGQVTQMALMAMLLHGRLRPHAMRRVVAAPG